MFAQLFEPICIGKMVVKNRFVVPAMGVSLCGADGRVSQRLVDYWTLRAQGGFGLCTVEFSCVSPEGRALPNQLMIDDDACVEDLARLSQAIHTGGAKASIQLHHAGRATMTSITGLPVLAPSAIPCHLYGHYGSLPREMTNSEIQDVIAKFVRAALRAKMAGFDAIELHAGHGYLLAQFLSPAMNKRVDDYGGDMQGRVKIITDIIKAIKKQLGADFPVLVKLSAQDELEEGNQLIDSCQAARFLAEAGADGLVISTGSYGHMEHMVASANVKPGFNLPAAWQIKAGVTIPVIGLGRINTPQLAAMAIERQMCDLVALGRASLADPEFPIKTQEGRISEIAPCIACLQRCQGEHVGSQPGAGCLVNPLSMSPRDWPLTAAPIRKKVVIVGAGPAGMQAAWLLAKRGHDVTVLEQCAAPGGQLHTAAMPPYKQDFTRAIRYYWMMGQKYGVHYRWQTRADESLVLSLAPDAVILATGALPARPPIQGLSTSGCVLAQDVLEGKALAGEICIVLGGGPIGLETADYLASYDKQITIVEQRETLPANDAESIASYRRKRFQDKGVVVLTGLTVTAMEKGAVICTRGEETLRLEAQTLILALGVKAHQPFDLTGKVAEFYRIGDCVRPRKALQAIYEATELAMTL